MDISLNILDYKYMWNKKYYTCFLLNTDNLLNFFYLAVNKINLVKQ